MNAVKKPEIDEVWSHPVGSRRPILAPRRERQLLAELADCRETLAAAVVRNARRVIGEKSSNPRALSCCIAETGREQGASEHTLQNIHRRYFAIRTELALANIRLVAHVVGRYRHRGVAYSDLIQEGFCGLLEAIDRFDLSHETKLSMYATWWIRHAVQSAVASGAYPVRLTPRRLRQLARDQEQQERKIPREDSRYAVAPGSMSGIHPTIRPAVSLGDMRPRALPQCGGPALDGASEIDLKEAVEKLMKSLRPRERRVISFRFGLGGSPRLSLSQVGKVLAVSKERVRQIQDAALKVLRTNASHDSLIHELLDPF
jgi:RNA polymerase primary sigma factor